MTDSQEEANDGEVEAGQGGDDVEPPEAAADDDVEPPPPAEEVDKDAVEEEARPGKTKNSHPACISIQSCCFNRCQYLTKPLDRKLE